MGLGFITEILGYANMFALSGIIVLVITLAFWLWCSSVILLSWRESKQAPDERRALKAAPAVRTRQMGKKRLETPRICDIMVKVFAE